MRWNKMKPQVPGSNYKHLSCVCIYIYIHSKRGLSWENLRVLGMKKKALTSYVSCQQCWINPRRALNAWEGDLEWSPAISDRRGDSEDWRVRPIHFPIWARSDLYPSRHYQCKTPLFCQPGGRLVEQRFNRNQPLSYSLSFWQSVTLICMCGSVWQQEGVSGRQRGQRESQEEEIRAKAHGSPFTR